MRQEKTFFFWLVGGALLPAGRAAPATISNLKFEISNSALDGIGRKR
jgi:hypothetical protein